MTSLSVDVSYDNLDVTFAGSVCRQLELILESMRNELFWLKNMRYELSFICPVCCEGGIVGYCDTHRKKRMQEGGMLPLLVTVSVLQFKEGHQLQQISYC